MCACSCLNSCVHFLRCLLVRSLFSNYARSVYDDFFKLTQVSRVKNKREKIIPTPQISSYLIPTYIFVAALLFQLKAHKPLLKGYSIFGSHDGDCFGEGTMHHTAPVASWQKVRAIARGIPARICVAQGPSIRGWRVMLCCFLLPSPFILDLSFKYIPVANKYPASDMRNLLDTPSETPDTNIRTPVSSATGSSAHVQIPTGRIKTGYFWLVSMDAVHFLDF